LWDGEGGFLVAQLAPPDDRATVTALASFATPDGAEMRLVVADVLGTLRVCSTLAPSPSVLFTLGGHSPVRRLGCFHSVAGRPFIVSVDDDTARVFEGEAGAEACSVAGVTAPCFVVYKGPTDGVDRLVTVGGRSVQITDPCTGNVLRTLDGNTTEVTALAVYDTAEGEVHLVTDAREQILGVFNPEVGTLLWLVRAPLPRDVGQEEVARQVMPGPAPEQACVKSLDSLECKDGRVRVIALGESGQCLVWNVCAAPMRTGIGALRAANKT
jgi:hypothetical protein